MKKILALLMLACTVVSMVGCGGKKKGDDEGYTVTYTYNSYSTSLADKWNPHTWETNADSGVLTYLSTPFVDMSIKDSENQVYQWTYKAATAVEDVTASHTADLTKYAVNLDGKDPSEVKEGYVFQITLRDGIKWQNGEEITVDDYVESFKRLLDPDMQNYRANNYYTGETAVAGANGYFHSGRTAYIEDTGVKFADLVKGDDGVYATADGNKVYIAVSTPLEAYLSGATIVDYADYMDPDALAALQAASDADGRAPLNDDTYAELVKCITYSADWGEDESYAYNYFLVEQAYPTVTWDTVGLYKLDDKNLIYVNEVYCDIDYFLAGLTSNWLVYIPYYDDNKDTTGSLVTTSYGTDISNSMSYGPYIIDSLQKEKQLVYTKNPYYYAFTEDEKTGRLVGTSNWDVDGEAKEVFQADKIIIDVMTDDAAKQAFLKGQLDDWGLPADEVVNYSMSDQLYKEDETYTMRFFLNTNLDALKGMDANTGNQNSVVMSNWNFRKGFTLAIDRADWVKATAGYKPMYGLLNNLYFYNIYKDPTSMYRTSDEAMQAICDLYNVEYGAGKAYATLKEAYESITGYNVTEAKEYFTKALAELTADGLYKEGDPIKIRLGYKKGALDSTDTKQVQLIQDYLNAAVEGTGFGKIELEAVGNIENRYTAVPNGEFAIGYGAWGGAAFYPFTMFRVYCDPDYAAIHEAACWNPAKDTLTININGEDRTETYQWWSNCMAGNGEFAAPGEYDTKLHILAAIEKNYLDKLYCIPLAGSTICNLLSYKVNYYTPDYNIMYGFGGMELLKFNYTDEEWTKFVESKGGTLSYE
ncbi:MAG: hypothetical protein II464_04315 [Oscillospiraceae bacterium]|nr:hypothetical protein [Oscillospiraceae bacterium]